MIEDSVFFGKVNYDVIAERKIKLRNSGGHGRENNTTISAKQSLLVQAPYLTL